MATLMLGIENVVADARIEESRRIDQLVDLADHLPPQDRHLVRAVLLHGQSITGLAQILGQPRHQVDRRFRRLTRRMLNPRYRAAARHAGRLTAIERWWLAHWVFAGRPLRMLAAELGMTLHGARKYLSGLSAKLARLERDRTRPRR